MSERLYSPGITLCRPRRRWAATVISVIIMLTLSAMTGWMWSCVRRAAGEVHTGGQRP